MSSRVGRPEKLNDARHREIVDLVAVGVPFHRAARAAGVDPGTMRRWMQRGQQQPHSRYARFRADVLDAEATAVTRMYTEFMNLVTDDDTPAHVRLRAATTYLERRMPEEFGRVHRTELTGAAGAPIEVRAIPQQPVDDEAIAKMQEVMLRAELIDENDLRQIGSPNGGDHAREEESDEEASAGEEVDDAEVIDA